MKKYSLILVFLFLLPIVLFSQESNEEAILLGNIIKQDFQKMILRNYVNLTWLEFQLEPYWIYLDGKTNG